VISRCQNRVTSAHTRDCAWLSPGARHALQVATFPATFSASCECQRSQGRIDPSDCKGWTIFGPDGREVATFGPDFTVAPDETTGAILVMHKSPQRLTATQDHAIRMKRINERNKAFWRPVE
jgi:hypothetical protein